MAEGIKEGLNLLVLASECLSGHRMAEIEIVVKDGNNLTGWILLSCVTVCCKGPAGFPVQQLLFFSADMNPFIKYIVGFDLERMMPADKRESNRLKIRSTEHCHHGSGNVELGFLRGRGTPGFLIQHVSITLKYQFIVYYGSQIHGEPTVLIIWH